MTKAFRVVIPARLGSTRLPGKVLLDLHGKPVIQHVYERGLDSGASEVIIATDDEAIVTCAESFGAQVCLTRSDHESGTTRIEEVSRKLGWNKNDIVINLQGDEPLMPGALVAEAAAALTANPHADIATVATPIHDAAEFNNPNAVKVICDQHGNALYFSRSAIPNDRDTLHSVCGGGLALRHVGLYAYRVSALQQYCSLESCALERIEALEQLRALFAGMKIHVTITDQAPPPGIDTASDLEAALKHLSP